MRQFKKSTPVPMEPWTPDVDMTNVSIHPSLVEEGHPKEGDFVAHDPNNVIDRWLVSAKYHDDTYTEVFRSGKYEAGESEIERVSNCFTYHSPLVGQPERYKAFRSQALVLALRILVECPPSREKSLALTKLEETVMWANASIARNEKE